MSVQLKLERYEAIKKASKKVEEVGTSLREQRVERWLRELAEDAYVYDLRNWREQGITPEEVRLRYENPEMSCHCIFDGECPVGCFPNVSASRALGWIFPHLREEGVPTERVVEVIMKNRKRNLQRMRGGWRRSLEWYKRVCLDKDLEAHDMESFLNWLDRAEHVYDLLCRVCKELEIEPDPKPEWLTEFEAVKQGIIETKARTKVILAQIHRGGRVGT